MFKYIESEIPSRYLNGNRSNSEFLQVMTSKWDKLQEQNIFRYKIDSLQTRTVGGKYLLQLNVDRGVKRRCPQEINSISQPFDHSKFNFTKIPSSELLFDIVKVDNGAEFGPYSLLVNVSPISKYHSLLVPSRHNCLPQVVTAESLEICIDIMFLSQDRHLRIGFNSMLALASVNHLHFHLLREQSTLPAEILKAKHVIGNLFILDNYPAPAFCFQIALKEEIKLISTEAFKVVDYFQKKNIAHNIFITRGESFVPGNQDCEEIIRVIIWPRKNSSYSEQLAAFHVALCELSGWFPIHTEEDFNSLKTEDLENELKKWKIDNFNDLCDEIKSLF